MQRSTLTRELHNKVCQWLHLNYCRELLNTLILTKARGQKLAAKPTEKMSLTHELLAGSWAAYKSSLKPNTLEF